MGKSKKKKNPDFRKAKLKIGKKLKRSNDTQTNFQSRKVVLFEQLKSSAPILATSELNEHLSSQRNLNLKEICQRIRHHNVNVRREAVKSIKESIVRQNYDQLRLNLKILLENLCLLITDLDSDVRNSTFYALKEILQRVKSIDICPSFRIMTAHLMCASTHLNPSIKIFSVKIIELLIEKLPNLCRGDKNLLKTFADLLNFGDKTVPRNFKSTFALGLFRILKVNFEKFEPLSESDDAVAKEICVINPKNCSLTANRQNPFEFSIFSDGFSLNPGKDSFATDPDLFYYIAERAISFCHAFWLEITTTDNLSREIREKDDGPRFFDFETFSDMSNVVGIFEIIFKKSKENAEALDLSENEASAFRKLFKTYFENNNFLKHYVDVFPSHVQQRKFGQQKNGDVFENFVDFNLNLAEILSQNPANHSKISEYLNKIQRKKNLSEDKKRKIENILQFLK